MVLMTLIIYKILKKILWLSPINFLTKSTYKNAVTKTSPFGLGLVTAFDLFFESETPFKNE